MSKQLVLDRFKAMKILVALVFLLFVSLVFTPGLFFGLNFPSEVDFVDNSMVCRFYFDEPGFSKVMIDGGVFTRVDMEDCFSYGEPGFPSLPVFSAHILIPRGREVESVSVEYGSGVVVDWDFDGKPVVPMQDSYPFSCMPSDPVLVLDDGVYSSDLDVKSENFLVGESGFCRGYEILTVELYPVDYRPGSGFFCYYPEMNVVVDFVDDMPLLQDEEDTNHFLRMKAEDEDFISGIIANPDALGSYSQMSFGDGSSSDGGQVGFEGDGSSQMSFEYSGGLCDPADSFDYVIITNSSLVAPSAEVYNWSDLIRHRSSVSGLSGTIVTVEEIESCSDYDNVTATFNDAAAHIREFCKDAYQDWGTIYVLLGGDWGTTGAREAVPFRLFTDRYEGATYDTMSCDKYFSHLDGDWYYTNDGVWGGGKSSGVNDLYGELYVGRITAYNASMVSNAVNKIIKYDNDSVNLSDSWYGRSSFWGGDLGWSITAKDYMEEIRLGSDTYRTFTGFEEWNSANPDNEIDTSERIYHADIGSGYSTKFKNSVEDDNASIVNHLDHSTWNSPFTLTSWSTTYNTKPFFGFTQGCLAGRFHSGYAGCEQMMCRHFERHAFALVLNTGYGYGSGSTTNGASQYIQAYFWDYFFNNQSGNTGNWQLGKAFMYASDKMAAVINSNSAAWCYAWYSANFFGDPAQLLNIGRENTAPVVSSPSPGNSSSGVSKSLSELSVTVNDAEGDSFNWTIETSPDVGSSSANGESNGSKTCSVSGLSYNTSYNWYVNVTDGERSACFYYDFTTEELEVNDAPSFSSMSPGNGSSNVDVSISEVSLSISDDDGDSFNWTIETSPDVGSSSANGESNGSKTCSVSGLVFDTIYSWYVNSTDTGSGNWTNRSYVFTTRSEYVADAPGSFTGVADGRFAIDLSWVDDTEADSTRVEYSSVEDGTWSVGDHSLLYNGSAGLTSHSGLSAGTSHYYKAWSYNTTDAVYSSGSVCNQSTLSNNAPGFSSMSPGNGSSNQGLDVNWTVSISDADGDSFNWTIECGGNSNSGNNENNGTKYLSLSGLSFNTDYVVWVNATDSYESISRWYNFSTRSEYEPEPPDIFTAMKYNRTGVNLSWSHGSDSDKTYVRYKTGGYPSNRADGSLLGNFSDISSNVSGLSMGTTYYFRAWSYNNTDGVWSSTYSSDSATTDSNNVVSLGVPTPVNGSGSQQLSFSWSIGLSDSDGDSFHWFINCSNGDNNSAVDDSDGSKSLSITGLSYDTEYIVWVNCSDGYSWVRRWFNFSTRAENEPSVPGSFSAVSDGRFDIDLSWSKGDNADYTRVEYKNSSGSWSLGAENLLYNSTGTSSSISGYSPGSTVYFQGWSYNVSDAVWSSSYSSDSTTTDSDNVPVFSGFSPVNGSTGENVSLTWNLTISDSDGDSFRWFINCSNGDSDSAVGANNGSKSCVISGLSYDTEYKVWVNCSDGYSWSRSWYIFTTGSEPPNSSPEFSSMSPGNGSTGVSVSLSSVSLSISDSEGDSFNWTIETIPDIGNSSANGESNGSKSCSVSGLSYSTTYTWYVNSIDLGSGNWTNRSYVFTTESQSTNNDNNGGGGGGAPPLLPVEVVADAGGSYSGFVDEEIAVDGSGSSGSSITGYKWDWDLDGFYDTEYSSSATESHSWSSAGNYTIKLKVKDSSGITDTDTTYVVVEVASSSGDNTGSNDSGGVSNNSSGSQDDSSQSPVFDDTDFDSDGVPDVIEEDLGLNSSSSEGVEKKTVNDKDFYFVDADSDGRSDHVYISGMTNYSKVEELDDRFVLIDVDNDNVWDYKYDRVDNVLSVYEEVDEKNGSTHGLFSSWMIGVAIVVISSVVVIFLLRSRFEIYIEDGEKHVKRVGFAKKSPVKKQVSKKQSVKKKISGGEKKRGRPPSKKMGGDLREIKDYYEPGVGIDDLRSSHDVDSLIERNLHDSVSPSEEFADGLSHVLEDSSKMGDGVDFRRRLDDMEIKEGSDKDSMDRVRSRLDRL